LSELLSGQTIVFIGDSTYKSYEENGIILPRDVSIESPFLPPDQAREREILKTYPQELFIFAKEAAPLIVANAFQLSLLNEKDLYGFDMCVHMVRQLKNDFPHVKLVFALAQIGDQNYFERLRKQIANACLQNDVFFLTDQKELWPLLKRADLFVRPTLSDSFGISIAEALQFGTPAVASDVCIRPEGTMLFRCGDADEFFEKVLQVLHKRESECKLKNTRNFKQHERF
jgi:glycosyltransferase involved in cell wall biosynthesis